MAAAVRLIPLVVGWLDHDASVFCPGAHGPISAPVSIWLLELDGARVLVDTGAGPPEPAAAHGHPHYRRAQAEEPAARLRAIGADPASIGTVVLTHLHWDHAYGPELCPRARAVVQASEQRFAAAPPETSRPHYEHGVDGVDYLQRWSCSAVDGACRLRDHVELIPLPGHTPGCQGVLLDHPDVGRWLVAGDAVPLGENLARRQANGIAHDPAASQRTIERIIDELDCVALPSHDPVLARWDGRDVLGSWGA